jgi:invasion protein IalB
VILQAKLGKSKFYAAAALAILLVSGPVVSLAQDAPQNPPANAKNFGPRKVGKQAAAANQPPPAETIGKFGAWTVQCADAQGADGKPAKACGMLQGAKSEKNPNIQLSVIVSKIKQGAKSQVLMRVLAPIGVYLPTGIPVEIDGAALPNRMQFTRCSPRICEGFGEASPESLKKFMKGGAATFYLYDRPGNGFPLKISLEGFAAGLTALDKL